MSDEISTVGWDAISGASVRYGDQEPLHWGTLLRYAIGGQDPLDGISAYRHPGVDPHWHFVTYGFSELYEKESSDPAVSGFGFELTFRLCTKSFDEPPPNWVLNFLQNLARYVFSSGNVFESGHYMALNGPIALDTETKIWAIVFAWDPELPGIDTPSGHLDFLQIIGISLDELAAVKAWNAKGFLELALPRLPLDVTDLGRASLTDDSEIAHLLEANRQRDGSATAYLFVSEAKWEIDDSSHPVASLSLSLGANGIRDFKAILPGRLPHHRPLLLAAKDYYTLNFEPAEECGWSVEGKNLTVRLTEIAAQELARCIAPIAGTYTIPAFPSFVVHVLKSETKNAEGEVVETIG